MVSVWTAMKLNQDAAQCLGDTFCGWWGVKVVGLLYLLIFLAYEFELLLTYDPISPVLKAGHVTLGRILRQIRYVKQFHNAEACFVRYDLF